ncbi:MAG TPA: histidine phosphatase family protein [Thermomicrobiales bacterium]|nr:histidine phosphatase family protein [Thermomicrobiales bacterium]
MRLLLVRHGQSLGNIESRIQGDDDPLTDHGRAQARAAARALAERGDITHLYASTLMRAFETASIIGRAIGLDPVPVPGLAEINAGTAAGMLWSEWSAQFPEEARRMASDDRYLEAWAGGESGKTFSERVLAAYNEIVTRHQGTQDTVTVVSHGGALAWISAHIHGDPMDVWPSARAGFVNCSISELEIDATGQGEIIAWNQADHLGALETAP